MLSYGGEEVCQQLYAGLVHTAGKCLSDGGFGVVAWFGGKRPEAETFDKVLGGKHRFGHLGADEPVAALGTDIIGTARKGIEFPAV